MAHALYAQAKPFKLHYSAASRRSAGFLTELLAAPWAERVSLHLSDESGRAQLDHLIPQYVTGQHLYSCGSARYMDGVFAAASANGWPDSALSREYFSVPEAPARINHPFQLVLKRSGRTLEVPASRTATDVLAECGVPVIVKCSDGICGTCATAYLAGEIDHRDFVLSNRERQTRVILCCSRAKEAGGSIELDL